MNIDLTQEEIILIDKAIKEWQVAPRSQGMVGSILGAMLCKDKDEATHNMKREMAIVDEEIRVRELQVMRLRLKLHEVKGRESEFNTIPA
jgi:hypothetical protein